MINKKKFINCISDLNFELRKNKKNSLEKFYISFLDDFEKTDNKEVLNEMLREFCSSGQIVQYANFNYSEELLFDKCYEEAKKLMLLYEDKSAKKAKQ